MASLRLDESIQDTIDSVILTLKTQNYREITIKTERNVEDDIVHAIIVSENKVKLASLAIDITTEIIRECVVYIENNSVEKDIHEIIKKHNIDVQI